MKKKIFGLFVVAAMLMFSSCATYVSQARFPAADEIFITSGDGDIQKPYTPVGQLVYFAQGFRIPLPLFGLIPFKDIDPDVELKSKVYRQVKEMGGDALINMRITWQPAKPNVYLLGTLATGGSIVVYGTVIKR